MFFGVGALGLCLVLGGIALAYMDKSAESSFSLFGNEFSSTSVGLSMAFIGAVVLVTVVVRLLKSIDHLAGLPDVPRRSRRSTPGRTS